MSTFSTTISKQEKEIRALALQAAATWATASERTATDMVLEVARDFEIYIKDGTIPSDHEDDLDIDGTGR